MKDMKRKAFLATMAFAIASSNVMAGTYRVKGKVANHGGREVMQQSGCAAKCLATQHCCKPGQAKILLILCNKMIG